MVHLRIYAKTLPLAHQVALNHDKANITPRKKAMPDYSVEICRDSQSITDTDHAALRAYRFSDEDIWDIEGIVPIFGLSNRTVNVTSMRSNTEFYLMGRVAKG